MEPKIYLLPIGNIDFDLKKYLKLTVEKAFQCAAELMLPMKEELDFAYDAGRNQYFSTIILKKIFSRKPKGKRLLGIVDVDLFVPHLNFVFGEADVARGVCIISLTRLRQEYYGLTQDKALFFDRAAKEAVHELGHTYALGHCREYKCVMFFSNSLSDTDRKSAQFCSHCKNLLKVYD